MNKDKFNGHYMYGVFPDVTIKTNFFEWFVDDYYDELYDPNKVFFVTRILGRKVEFGLIGNGYFVSFSNRIKETIQEYTDRLYNSNSIIRLQDAKNTPEEFKALLEEFN